MGRSPRTVTALRARGRGRVAVELDGAPWRTLPVEPVLRAGLAPGEPLDRQRARELARELRRARALGTAVRALRRRDLPAAALDERLSRAGVGTTGRREAMETLERAGVLDDARYAAGRAAAMAARGYGDEAIRWDLERKGVLPDLAGTAIASLEPEPQRARRLLARKGGGPAGLALLARRGFGEEALEALRDAVGGEGP